MGALIVIIIIIPPSVNHRYFCYLLSIPKTSYYIPYYTHVKYLFYDIYLCIFYILWGLIS